MTDEQFEAPPTAEEIAEHRNLMNIVDVALRRERREYTDEEVIKDLTEPTEDTGGTLLRGKRFMKFLLTEYVKAHGTLTPR